MEKTLKIESGLQLFSRITHHPSLDKLHPVLFPDGGPQPNTTLQITGGESTGKTLFVTELIARCILPSEHNDKPISGKKSGAVLINTDHHFSLFKLIAIMESILREFREDDIKAIVEKSLRRLTVFNCYSSEELVLSLRNLERILADDLGIKLLAIDGVLAQYWYDRGVNGATNINAYAQGVLGELARVSKGRNLVTVFTKLESEKMLSCPFIDFTMCLKKLSDEDYAMVFHEHKDKRSFSRNYIICSSGLVFDERNKTL